MKGEGQEGGFSVVSVVCGSGGSKSSAPINMKKINMKDKKDREVGREGRKTFPDNSNTRKHMNPCNLSPVVSTPKYPRCPPRHTRTAVSNIITPDTHAGDLPVQPTIPMRRLRVTAMPQGKRDSNERGNLFF